jgi:hypothetical protein
MKCLLALRPALNPKQILACWERLVPRPEARPAQATLLPFRAVGWRASTWWRGGPGACGCDLAQWRTMGGYGSEQEASPLFNVVGMEQEASPLPNRRPRAHSKHPNSKGTKPVSHI